MYKVVIVELSGCVTLESKILKEFYTYSMKLSNILTLRGDDILSILMVSYVIDSDEYSCIMNWKGISLL